MRYHSIYGTTYSCNHPVYDRCTLFQIGRKGLAIIQQRFDKETKSTYWTEIDPWLTYAIYLHSGFKKLFDERSSEPVDGLYPPVTIRQVMWALKMKPMKREHWETCLIAERFSENYMLLYRKNIKGGIVYETYLKHAVGN